MAYANKAKEKAWLELNKPRRQLQAAQWYLRNKQRLAIERARTRVTRISYLKQWRASIRKEVFAAYGGKCACCGEPNEAFLLIDHVNNDGNTERKQLGLKASQLFRHIKKSGYPQKYQLLCWNCNAAKAFRGGCPHRGERT